jgi:hypothetical protein
MEKIILIIEINVRADDPELTDKILGRIYTMDAVEDVRLIHETKNQKA